MFVGMLLFHFHCVADWASDIWQWTTARSARDPLCPDWHSGNVTVIARSPYAAGQLLFKPMQCSFDQISHCRIFGVRHAYRGQQLGYSYQSSPLIPLSVINVRKCL
jgi:hypothetical protein